MFGEEAIQKGYLRREELEKALVEQERIKQEKGKNLFLGEVLVELKLMTEKQVLDVL